MAIIQAGRILMEDEPTTAIDALAGRVWRRTIDKAQLDDYRAEYHVLSTRLVLGRTAIRVLSDTLPGEGFEPASPDLEDVYFATLEQAVTA